MRKRLCSKLTVWLLYVLLLLHICSRALRIGLTVPEMDIAGLYRINGEVFILPLEGGGSFTTKMSSVKATGHSLIYSVINPEGRKVTENLSRRTQTVSLCSRSYKFPTSMLISGSVTSSFN